MELGRLMGHSGDLVVYWLIIKKLVICIYEVDLKGDKGAIPTCLCLHTSLELRQSRNNRQKPEAFSEYHSFHQLYYF